MVRSPTPLLSFSTLRGIRLIVRLLLRLRLLWIIVIASLFLSGCVHYEVGMQFADTNHGEMIHSIRFSQPITGVSSTLLTAWLETIEKPIKRDGGSIQHPNSQEWVIRVPFYNAKDLETKFSHLLQPPPQPRSRLKSKLPTDIASLLHFTTGNLILWQRHHLQYDLDLRGLDFALPIPELRSELNTESNTGSRLNPESSAASPTIEIRLNTPW